MQKFYQVLVMVSCFLVLGSPLGVAMAQPLVEFALSLPGMWEGIDPQDGSRNQLSITFKPDVGGGGGGGGGGFIIVAASTFFSLCEGTPEGQGVAQGTGKIRDGNLVSTDWTLTCRGERSRPETTIKFIPNRNFSQLTMPLVEREIVFFRVSNSAHGLGHFGVGNFNSPR